ncbi:MAG: hypothetical protein ABI914_04390 [Acidobacteriota bacterium]
MTGGVLRERQPGEGFGKTLGVSQVSETRAPELFDGLGVSPGFVRVFPRAHPLFEIVAGLLRRRRKREQHSDQRDQKHVSKSHKNHEIRRTTIRPAGCKIHAPLLSPEGPPDPGRRRSLTAILRR